MIQKEVKLDVFPRPIRLLTPSEQPGFFWDTAGGQVGDLRQLLHIDNACMVIT